MEAQTNTPSWTDWLQTIAVLVASGSAIFGILQWRIQSLTQRRMALAEEVLSAFYQAQEIIAAARSPFTPAGEGRSWRDDEELADNRLEMSRVDAYFAPTERLNSKSEFFAKFRAVQYRFTAVFGPEVTPHFEAIWAARHSVFVSSTMLAQAERDRIRGAEPLDENTRMEWEADIWRMGKKDEISPKISEAVVAIEKICRPVLTKWFKI